MNKLSEIKLKKSLGDAVSVIHYKSVDSTNTQVRRLVGEGAATPLLVVANEQTAGRGRQGKSFYSPADTGIYMSLALDKRAVPCDTVTLTAAAGVAVCRAIESLTDIKPEIKWVNDVLVDGKKVSGILCEAADNYYIVGIGVNISTELFPADIENAGSLDVKISKAALVERICRELFEAIKENSGYMDYYRAHSAVLGKRICFIQNGVKHLATAEAIDDLGGLEVICESGERLTLRSGEITLRTV